MQTFLPYRDFYRCAAVLDSKRLGKQRVEVIQILTTLRAKREGSYRPAWVNHPAVLQWEGYEATLCVYGFVIIAEWTKRGYKDKTLASLRELQSALPGITPVPLEPPWLRHSQHLRFSHQSNLVRKDYAHYSQYFPQVPSDLPYFWPVTHPGTSKHITADVDRETIQLAMDHFVEMDGSFFIRNTTTRNNHD